MTQLNKVRNIEISKNNNLDKLLFGLGIRHAGEKVSKVLAAHFGSLERLKKAEYDQLINIEEIGDVIDSGKIPLVFIPQHAPDNFLRQLKINLEKNKV